MTRTPAGIRVLVALALVGAVDTDRIDDGGGCNGGRTIPITLTEPETTSASSGEPASDEPGCGDDEVEGCDDRRAAEERGTADPAPATQARRREP